MISIVLSQDKYVNEFEKVDWLLGVGVTRPGPAPFILELVIKISNMNQSASSCGYPNSYGKY